MFRWREREPGEGYRFGVDWAVTDRHGGTSTGRHDSLNLGAHVADDVAAVATNRARAAEAFGLPVSALRFMDQQHGTDVAWVGADVPDAMSAPAADALLTDSTEVVLAVLVADCTPVLLLDRVAGLAGVVHAGRPGMVAGVVPAAVGALRARGATDLEAVVGPSVCPRCYEVPEPMRAEATAVHPAAYAASWAGTPAIDVAGTVVAQLADLQVPLRWLPGCTREDPDLYSYRRDGRTGRFAGLIRLLPPEGAA